MTSCRFGHCNEQGLAVLHRIVPSCSHGSFAIFIAEHTLLNVPYMSIYGVPAHSRLRRWIVEPRHLFEILS